MGKALEVTLYPWPAAPCRTLESPCIHPVLRETLAPCEKESCLPTATKTTELSQLQTNHRSGRGHDIFTLGFHTPMLATFLLAAVTARSSGTHWQ